MYHQNFNLNFELVWIPQPMRFDCISNKQHLLLKLRLGQSRTKIYILFALVNTLKTVRKSRVIVSHIGRSLLPWSLSMIHEKLSVEKSGSIMVNKTIVRQMCQNMTQHAYVGSSYDLRLQYRHVWRRKNGSAYI